MIPDAHFDVSSLKPGQKTCFFGIGALLEECYRQLVLMAGGEPYVLCDNAPEKWHREFWGRRCLSPDELRQMPLDTVIFITVRNYYNIYQQLRRYGFENVFICRYDRGYNVVHDIAKPVSRTKAIPKTIHLENKWTLVTGAARGIGRQICVAMARSGSNIVGHSRSLEHCREVAEVCTSLGSTFIPVAAELGNLSDLEAMLAEVERLVPHIDIVFNNAAISPSASDGFWSTSPRDYLECYAVNTMAPIRICQHFIPPMVQRGFGRVINITSSIQKRPAEMAYACSKAALNKFVHDLAPSLDKTGVMLTLLDPGWLQTNMGGAIAPYPVESVIPGAILGALLDHDINGSWIDAQEYAGLSTETAVCKAFQIYTDKE